jgi:DNA-binding transcriptional LysR family regulator
MQNINWDDLRVFLLASKSTSLSAAAELLGINHTTISRRISSLEQQLKGALFDRSKRQWRLTNLGKQVSQEAEPMQQSVTRIERLAFADSKQLQGRLRITAPEACISTLLLPIIQQFETLHPAIDIEIITTTKALDLASSEADIAFRVTNSPDPSLIGCDLGNLGVAVYGTTHNIKQLKTLSNRKNNRKINCLSWTDSPPREWIQRDVGDHVKIINTNSMTSMADMCRNGLGLAQLFCLVGDSYTELERLPNSYYLSSNNLWLLTHVDLRTSIRVRAFREFAIKKLRLRQADMEGALSSI